MNSVMEIGDNILFLSEGEMCWVGTRKEVLYTENQKLQEFVFDNKQYQKIRAVSYTHLTLPTNREV